MYQKVWSAEEGRFYYFNQRTGRKTYTRPSFMPAEDDEDGSAWNTRSRASGPLSAAGSSELAAGSSELSGGPSKLTAASFLSEGEGGVSVQSSLPTGSDEEEAEKDNFFSFYEKKEDWQEVAVTRVRANPSKPHTASEHPNGDGGMRGAIE